MQPFDDRLSEEMNEPNEEMIAFLRQAYDKAEVNGREPDPGIKTAALAAVRQRLLETQSASFYPDDLPSEHTHAELPDAFTQPVAPLAQIQSIRARRWRRSFSLLAAILCVAVLVGSMLAVFGALKHNASTQVSTLAGAQALYIATTGWLQKIDAATGGELWRVQLPVVPGNHDVPMNFPLVGNSAVYVTANNTLFAFRVGDGRQLWSTKVSNGSLDAGGQSAQPVLADGRLYYVVLQSTGTANQVSYQVDAFDTVSGHLLWHYQPVAGWVNDIAVNNGNVYLNVQKWTSPDETVLVALRGNDGSVQWSTGTAAGHVPASSVLNGNHEMVVANDKVYQLLSAANCGAKDGDCLFAWNAETGAPLWHSQNLAPASAQYQLAFTGSLIAGKNALYIDSIGGLFALDASNGHVLWRQSDGLPLTSKSVRHPLGQPFAGKGNPGNAFVVLGEQIYRMEMTNQGDDLVTLDARDGRIVARQHVEDFYCSLSAQVNLNTKQYTGVCMLEGLMTETTSYVFPTVGRLDALDNHTGQRLWSIVLAGNSPAVITQAA